jgi:hypothetical protein
MRLVTDESVRPENLNTGKHSSALPLRCHSLRLLWLAAAAWPLLTGIQWHLQTAGCPSTSTASPLDDLALFFMGAFVAGTLLGAVIAAVHESKHVRERHDVLGPANWDLRTSTVTADADCHYDSAITSRPPSTAHTARGRTVKQPELRLPHHSVPDDGAASIMDLQQLSSPAASLVMASSEPSSPGNALHSGHGLEARRSEARRSEVCAAGSWWYIRDGDAEAYRLTLLASGVASLAGALAEAIQGDRRWSDPGGISSDKELAAGVPRAAENQCLQARSPSSSEVISPGPVVAPPPWQFMMRKEQPGRYRCVKLAFVADTAAACRTVRDPDSVFEDRNRWWPCALQVRSIPRATGQTCYTDEQSRRAGRAHYGACHVCRNEQRPAAPPDDAGPAASRERITHETMQNHNTSTAYTVWRGFASSAAAAPTLGRL